VEYVAAVALSLMLLVAVANFIVVQYAQGVVRAALDEAVRDAARYFPNDNATAVETRCEQRAREVLNNLLRGRMGRRLTLRCAVTSTEVTATIGGHFEAWLSGIPDIDAGATAVAARERPF
jgi:hypothetical protein